MIIYPAIDIRNGNVVRLTKGDYSQETIYGSDPFVVAESFVADGASWIHLVDLDAARTGESQNYEVIKRIATKLPVSVQTGGGVRSLARVSELLDAGVKRVVIGTTAVTDQALTAEIITKFPNQIAIGIDARDNVVATQGWQESSELKVDEVMGRYQNLPVAAFIVTDINRDGALVGPDLNGLSTCVAATNVHVIASGGISSLGDLQALTTTGVAGAITGRALYEGKFTLKEALSLTGDN